METTTIHRTISEKYQYVIYFMQATTWIISGNI